VGDMDQRLGESWDADSVLLWCPVQLWRFGCGGRSSPLVTTRKSLGRFCFAFCQASLWAKFCLILFSGQVLLFWPLCQPARWHLGRRWWGRVCQQPPVPGSGAGTALPSAPAVTRSSAFSPGSTRRCLPAWRSS